MTVADVAAELRSLAGSFSQELLIAGSDVAAQRPAAGRWSPKEVLGHLIDSAANNHQRFVRAQQATSLTFPAYDQNEWVTLQRYQDAEWSHLVSLWMHLNLHLVHVISRIPPTAYSTPCTIGGGEPVALESVILGYLSHVKHHMAQIRDRLAQG